MKTAQIMERNLNGFIVRQNHKTGMFNATDLLKVFKKNNPRSKKRIDKYLETNSTVEYVNVIKMRLESQKSKVPAQGELEFTLTKAIDKDGDVVQSKSGRVNGGTWMHPYLFIDFAMWLSPEFKYECMKWLHDNLIQFRDQAGESFKEINIALTEEAGHELRQIEYIREAKMINSMVFDNGKGGQRNQATEAQLDLLDKLQKADIKMIKDGHSREVREKNLAVFKKLLS